MITFLKKILPKNIFNKIVSQFIFSYVFLVSLSIVFVGFFLITETNNFIKKSVSENQLEIARRSAKEIYYFVHNTFDILSYATTTNEINEMQPFKQQRILDELQINNKFYRKIFVVDTTGSIISTTEIGVKDTLYKETEIYNSASQLSQYISPVNIKDKRPVITVARRIMQFERKVGILAAEVDVSFIWELVDSLSYNVPGGLVFIVSDKGKVIAHPNRILVYNNEDFSGLPFMGHLLSYNEGTRLFKDPYNNNEPMLCAYKPVEELRWGIVVSQTKSEAFAVSRGILIKLIYIVIGSIIFASILGILITRNLVQPLKRLVEGVQRVSEGAVPGRIDIPRTDELATLAHEFNNMTENLEKIRKKLQMAERHATMTRFASVVAHEIRNPFNSIVINMRVLKRGMEKHENPERLEQYMEMIDQEINRIDGLIRNYLSLTKPGEFKPAPTDLNVLLDDLILSHHAKAVNQSIRIERESEEESLIIPADADQLKQAFLNIILNSIQAMPDGGMLKIAVLVHHDNKKHPSTVKVLFQDTGVGIKPEHLPDVFEFFYTSKPSGTGLGLAVTQQIIRMHHGTIEITSAPNHGTTVSVYLPK